MTSAEIATIRTIIVDDEPAARRGIRLLLSRDPSVAIVGEASNGEDAVALIKRERPDLAFLDVQMPGDDGFQVLARIAAPDLPAVVFVTAYDEHAVHAFEVNAVDYLLKPFEDARFHEALERAKVDLSRRSFSDAKADVRSSRGAPMQERLGNLLNLLESGRVVRPAHDRILIKSAGEIYFLKPDEIDWIEAEGDYMKFHVGGRTHLLRETMGQLEQRLDPGRFVRIHRSMIVNIDRVRKVSPANFGEYLVTLQDGTALKLSRGYQPRIAGLLKTAL